VRPGAAGLDQLVAHRARERDVGERAALARVVQVAELAAAELEHRAAEARLRGELHPLPVRDLSHERVDGDASVEACLFQCLIGHADMMQPQVHLKSNVENGSRGLTPWLSF